MNRNDSLAILIVLILVGAFLLTISVVGLTAATNVTIASSAISLIGTVAGALGFTTLCALPIWGRRVVES